MQIGVKTTEAFSNAEVVVDSTTCVLVESLLLASATLVTASGTYVMVYTLEFKRG